MPTPTYDGAVYDDHTVHEEDKRLLVQFYNEAVKNATKSAAEGRPVFDEIPHVKIITPGSRDVMVTRATVNYQQRFPRQWDQFVRMQTQSLEGTPLEQVPFLTVGQIAELKALNVLTLEQLANLSDSVVHKFMGAQKMKQQAQNYLDAAKSAAPMTQLMAELEKRDAQIAALQQQVEALVAAAKKPPTAEPAKKAA
jgi:hypothetical protein